MCGDAGPRGGTHFFGDHLAIRQHTFTNTKLRFGDKIDGPNSSARSVTSNLFPVSEETITTGIGRRRISFSRKSRPSIRGISTSVVNTSGLNFDEIPGDQRVRRSRHHLHIAMAINNFSHDLAH